MWEAFSKLELSGRQTEGLAVESVGHVICFAHVFSLDSVQICVRRNVCSGWLLTNGSSRKFLEAVIDNTALVGIFAPDINRFVEVANAMDRQFTEVAMGWQWHMKVLMSTSGDQNTLQEEDMVAMSGAVP